MGTIVASSIIARARKIFHDDTGVRWPDAECLDWLNDGQREVAILRPESSVVNGKISLVAGTRQTIPPAGIMLIDIMRNMVGAGNATPGTVIRIVDREILDSTLPTWHSDPAAANGEVQHYVFDGRDPKTFYVYPQPPATPHAVEAIYATSPADVAAVSNAITLDDIYANALLDYILYRSYSKDAEHSGNVNRAAGHYTAFATSLGLKVRADDAINPNNYSPQYVRTVAPEQVGR